MAFYSHAIGCIIFNRSDIKDPQFQDGLYGYGGGATDDEDLELKLPLRIVFMHWDAEYINLILQDSGIPSFNTEPDEYYSGWDTTEDEDETM